MALETLWSDVGVSAAVPAVDFDNQVVVFFGPAESSSCRFGPLKDVAYDPEVARVFPVLDFEDPVADGEERACTSDDNPHAIVVAIERSDLPDSDFAFWVEQDDPPACCINNVTRVAAGELDTADPDATTGPRTGAREEVVGYGTELGSASIGPALIDPQPWPIDTIYTDQQPDALVIEFTPPDPDCIAASATATIGRGGAILARLQVNDATGVETCLESGGTNQIVLPLSEPLDEQRVYTLAADESPDSGEFADDLADSVIGLDIDSASDTVLSTGAELRIIDDTAVESDYNPFRINVWVDDGIVEFADVG